MVIRNQNQRIDRKLIDWLLAGDISIQYQTHRDLMGENRPELQARIATEGWGARFLAARNPDGTWGRGFYQPKWTSSHYTLLDLKTLGMPKDNSVARAAVARIAQNQKRKEGGILTNSLSARSDACVNAMFINYASHFGLPERDMASMADFILDYQMDDGGFNCEANSERHSPRHSSLHTSISVLEGFHEFLKARHTYRRADIERAAAQTREFILLHRLYKSDHTGKIISPEFLRLSFPARWKYNILRTLDHFQAANIPWDERMSGALDVLISKRRADGRWPLQAAHPGAVHFKMEEARGPSRWNTLLALRVLKAYGANT